MYQLRLPKRFRHTSTLCSSSRKRRTIIGSGLAGSPLLSRPPGKRRNHLLATSSFDHSRTANGSFFTTKWRWLDIAA